MEDKEFKDKLDQCSKVLIANDGKTLADQRLINQSAIHPLYLIPFISLYCYEALEFSDDIKVDETVLQTVRDIRNGLKLPWEKYNKSIKEILRIDNLQDNYYSNLLKVSFLKLFNVHDNLGVYFSEDGEVVFNTQSFPLLLNKPNIDLGDSNNVKEVGFQLGRITAVIYNHYKRNCKGEVNVHQNPVKIGFIDYNTTDIYYSDEQI